MIFGGHFCKDLGACFLGRRRLCPMDSLALQQARDAVIGTKSREEGEEAMSVLTIVKQWTTTMGSMAEA